MPRIGRRSLLSATGAMVGAIAGCTSSGSSDQGTTEPQTPEKKKVIDGVYPVEEDHWQYWDFSFDEQRRFEFDFMVQDGPAIDVFVTDSRGYSHYKESESFQSISTLTVTDAIGTSADGVLNPGDYYLVMDNTNQFGAKPPTDFQDNVARVEMKAWEYY